MLRVPINFRSFLFLCIFYVVAVALFGVVIYQNDKKRSIDGIDTKLKTAANASATALGDEYLNAVYENKELAFINHASNTTFLRKLADSLDVKYLYSLVYKDGGIYFVSSSGTTPSSYSEFMEEYKSAPQELKEALKSKNFKELYLSYEDKWGSFRSYFALRTTDKGYPYIIAADVDSRAVDKLFIDSVIFSVLCSLYYTLIAVPGMYLLLKWVKQSKKEMIRQFTKDHLTGLENRVALLNRLERQGEYTLLIVNIDSFRELNDLYGHNWGDRLLTEFSDRLLEFVNSGELIYKKHIRLYRLHADEFGVVILKKCDKKLVSLLCERIQDAVCKESYRVDNHDVTLNITIGIGEMRDGNDGESGRYLLTTANIALKEAKKAKKPYAFYDESFKIEQIYEQNLIWINKLKKALQEDRIVPFFQPIRCNLTGKVVKYESLVRMVDEDGAIISPFFFLDVAKKSRLYHNITKVVIEKSFRYFSDKDSGLSVNLSVLDIYDPSIREFIFDALTRYEIGDRVTFEILESEGIDSYEEVYKFVEQAREMGCKISIDDFGSGYSNFDHILKIKPDIIKIDGSLIKEVCCDKNSQIIAKAIVGFAREIGAATVAEFVHSETVLQKVVEIGIDYSQGHYISEPKPQLLESAA